MNLLTFDQLSYASTCCHKSCPYLVLVPEWGIKRQHIAMYLHDLPTLTKAFVEKKQTPHPRNPSAAFVDPLPDLRLAAACEGLAHCVYAMADIAATVANRASKGGQIPASFNDVCKRAAKRQLEEALIAEMTDLEWYARIRELRTEWTHHSSIFIGEDDEGPLVCVNCYRRPGDQIEFRGRIQVRVEELMDWSNRATFAVDRFGSAIFYLHVLPKMPLDEVVYAPMRDEFGFPKMTDGKMQGEHITVREYLRRGGIEI